MICGTGSGFSYLILFLAFVSQMCMIARTSSGNVR